MIGYSRVFTRDQDTDRQQADLLPDGDRRDDFYIDHGVSGVHASRPGFDQALDALPAGDTLVVATLDRLGRSTLNMLALAAELRSDATLRFLNLGGGIVVTSTPMGGMMFTIMSALAEMELAIQTERITDSVTKRRAFGSNLGGRKQEATDSKLIQGGSPLLKWPKICTYLAPLCICASRCFGSQAQERDRSLSRER